MPIRFRYVNMKTFSILWNDFPSPWRDTSMDNHVQMWMIQLMYEHGGHQDSWAGSFDIVVSMSVYAVTGSASNPDPSSGHAARPAVYPPYLGCYVNGYKKNLGKLNYGNLGFTPALCESLSTTDSRTNATEMSVEVTHPHGMWPQLYRHLTPSKIGAWSQFMTYVR